MKRLVLSCFVLVFLAGSCFAAGEDSSQRMISALEQFYGPGVAASQMYVGSEICLACHPDQEGWRGSLHATGFKDTTHDTFTMQPKKGVVVDFDSNGVDDFKQGLDFNQISSVFDKYKPNAPILKFDPVKGYIVQIGMQEFPSGFAYGGSDLYKQRFVVKIPVADRADGYSAGYYVSPIQYNETVHQYVAYHPEDWYNADNSPRFTPQTTTAQVAAEGRSFDKKCSGCHFTGLSLGTDSNGEWIASAPPAVLYLDNDPNYFDFNGDGIKEHFNTGCERCHGPGGEHVISRGDPETIINPATDWTPQQANQLCGSCHSRGKSLPDGVHDFPIDETTSDPYADNLGEELYSRFWKNKHGLWPDGKSSRQHHQQFQDFLLADKSGYEFDQVTCFDCHDVHVDNLKHIRPTMTVQGTTGGEVTIATRMEDNSMCLACHAGFEPFTELRREDIADLAANEDRIATVVERHTFHAYKPDRFLGLSRCTECHMSHLAKSAVSYDIPAHTFDTISPSRTLATQDAGGMPNSCAARCHRPLADLFGFPADTSLTNWTEPSDVQLSQWLQTFYGPNGTWWVEKQQTEGDGGESDSGH